MMTTEQGPFHRGVAATTICPKLFHVNTVHKACVAYAHTDSNDLDYMNAAACQFPDEAVAELRQQL